MPHRVPKLVRLFQPFCVSYHRLKGCAQSREALVSNASHLLLRVVAFRASTSLPTQLRSPLWLWRAKTPSPRPTSPTARATKRLEQIHTTFKYHAYKHLILHQRNGGWWA